MSHKASQPIVIQTPFQARLVEIIVTPVHLYRLKSDLVSTEINDKIVLVPNKKCNAGIIFR